MASQSDSTTSGIPVTMTFTDQAARCVPPSVLEALRSADFRITLPAQTSVSAVRISTLPDNLVRVDGQGALYAPATQVVELTEQTIAFPASIAPGIPVTMSFSVPSVRDLETSFLNLFFDIQPPGSLVRPSYPRVAAGVLSVDFYRDIDEAGPPYDAVVIRGWGRIAVIPTTSS